MSGISRTRAAASHIQAKIFHPSHVESHTQDSSHVTIKSHRDSINREIGVAPRDWSTMPNPAYPKRGILVSAHISAEVGWCPNMLKPHAVTNGDQNISQQFW
ncbi:uncharacterized protein TNCV_207391 [Trichonephila clavipes]|nr:uncharacterized protein TNCV_207391 [Trichonephila clavipes]